MDDNPTEPTPGGLEIPRAKGGRDRAGGRSYTTASFGKKGETPAPPVEHELARIERAAALVAGPHCIHCQATGKVIAWTGTLPRAIAVIHEHDCPEYTP